MSKILIEPTKLHSELAAAGLPVISVAIDGRVEYSRLLSNAEKLTAEQLITNHDPVVIPPPTTDQIARALWNKVMRGDSSDADKILQILE